MVEANYEQSLNISEMKTLLSVTPGEATEIYTHSIFSYS